MRASTEERNIVVRGNRECLEIVIIGSFDFSDVAELSGIPYYELPQSGDHSGTPAVRFGDYRITEYEEVHLCLEEMAFVDLKGMWYLLSILRHSNVRLKSNSPCLRALVRTSYGMLVPRAQDGHLSGESFSPTRN